MALTLKGTPGKAKQGLVTGVLSSGPYLSVQTLGVSMAVILSNAWAATHNSCVLITGGEAGYYIKGVPSNVNDFRKGGCEKKAGVTQQTSPFSIVRRGPGHCPVRTHRCRT